MNGELPARGEYVHVVCPQCGADMPEHRLALVVSAIVTCRRCGQSYVAPRVSSAHIAHKLQLWAEQDVVDPERLNLIGDPSSIAYYARFLAWVERAMALPGRTILDVGCGTGAFLQVARSAGWSVRGVEIGRASADYAATRLGLDVSQGSFYPFVAPDGSFDALTMIEVIEHLEHPSQALDKARTLLRPGGVLLVTTPNVDSLYRRLCGNRWWVINCEDEHIVLFNRRTLSAMLESHGFEVVEVRVCGVDWLGLMREAVRRLRMGPPGPAMSAGGAVAGYYEARSTKSMVKRMLARTGLLRLVRLMLRATDRTYAWRWSPTRDWGEQLVVLARRRPD